MTPSRATVIVTQMEKDYHMAQKRVNELEGILAKAKAFQKELLNGAKDTSKKYEPSTLVKPLDVKDSGDGTFPPVTKIEKAKPKRAQPARRHKVKDIGDKARAEIEKKAIAKASESA